MKEQNLCGMFGAFCDIEDGPTRQKPASNSVRQINLPTNYKPRKKFKPAVDDPADVHQKAESETWSIRQRRTKPDNAWFHKSSVKKRKERVERLATKCQTWADKIDNLRSTKRGRRMAGDCSSSPFVVLETMPKNVYGPPQALQSIPDIDCASEFWSRYCFRAAQQQAKKEGLPSSLVRVGSDYVLDCLGEMTQHYLECRDGRRPWSIPDCKHTARQARKAMGISSLETVSAESDGQTLEIEDSRAKLAWAEMLLADQIESLSDKERQFVMELREAGGSVSDWADHALQRKTVIRHDDNGKAHKTREYAAEPVNVETRLGWAHNGYQVKPGKARSRATGYRMASELLAKLQGFSQVLY